MERRGQHRRARLGALRRRRPPEGLCFFSRHETTDLLAGERPAQVRERPSRMEEDRRGAMDVVEEEHALARGVEQRLEAARVHARVEQAFLQPRAVLGGLQPPHHPHAHVGQALVIEVDRVLGREHHAHALRPRLLQQGQERPLGGRVGRMGREVTVDLVHVDERSELRRAPLLAHPRLHLVEQESGDEEPLLVGEVRGVDDGQAGPAVGGVQQARDVERLALPPRREARRSEQVVERHGQLVALLARVHAVERQGAQLLEGRIDDGRDQRLQAQALPGPPRPLDECREQDVLPRAERIGFDPQQAQQAGDNPRDLVAQVLFGGLERQRRRLERLEDVERHARGRARRVDRGVAALLLRGHVGAREPPLGEALLPGGRDLRRGGVNVLALPTRRLGVDPGGERGRIEALEEQEQVAEVALRVDGDDRYALLQGLFDERDGEARLARAGHADDQAVREQVGRIEVQPGSEGTGAGVDFLAQVQALGHGRSIGRVSRSTAVLGRRHPSCGIGVDASTHQRLRASAGRHGGCFSLTSGVHVLPGRGTPGGNQ